LYSYKDKDYTEHINQNVLRLAIDPGDIRKPYAKAMENLCGIYDASEKQVLWDITCVK
jgi:hypothetical protein